MTQELFNIEKDYESLSIDGIVCDKSEIFVKMINKYIKEKRLEKSDWVTIGYLWEGISNYVNSTWGLPPQLSGSEVERHMLTVLKNREK